MKGITCVTLCVYTACLMLATSRALDGSGLDASAEQYLSRRNAEVARDANKMSLASWAYDCNLTETNKQTMMALQNENAAKSKSEWEQWKLLKWDEKWNQTTDPNLRRQLKQFSVQGMSALPSDKFSNLSEITADMVATYSTAHVDMCVELQNESVCDLNLEPELTQLLDQVRDYNVLTEAWVRWRDASGKRVRNNFLEYVQLSNEAARLNGFSDMSEMWLDPYESPSFQSDIEKIWQEVKPLYEQLHAYVRRKLREEYGANHVNLTGPIPASILGNMWAQSWGGIYDLVQPFPNKPTLDVTAAMKSQGYTAKKMFELADKFYTELNLIAMPASFWEKSVLTKPPSVDMVCHASAWDFYDGQDFRIKMCTDITMDDLFTIHHEMGHIEYYLHYKDQPYVFRSGANPGFHEAVGDSLALSVRTPKHLHKIGLLEQIVDDEESDINFLMKVALDKVTFLPFGYLIDKYRWRVFSGNITAQDLNCEWWNMRYELQGLKPPVQRSEEDFDPGAKYHVVADVPYIR
ncbi:hypothetical protein HAZT_HAZT011951 [Hyalella azteca]|nr:hypothetical protein HAZT_HAZT011951 [Hyalella azteca]